MQITIMNNSLTYPNEISSIDVCLQRIENILQDNQVYIEAMVIDGVEVYQDFHLYLADHIDQVAEIQVKVQTLQQVLDESVITARQYLSDALPQVPDLADTFYQGGNSEGWNQLTQLLEGLMWLSQTIEAVHIHQTYKNSASYSELSVRLREELANLENALNDKDMVLTGDLLKYEIGSIMESVLESVNETIDNEVIHHDFS